MFEILKFNNAYEIEKDFPHRIRKIGTTKFISEWEGNHGYTFVWMNKTNVQKHCILAIQFVPNDDSDVKIQVDHVNRIRLDNRIENLRWVSQSENIKNQTKRDMQVPEYLDELPNHVIEIAEYNNFEFKDLYFDHENLRILKRVRGGKIKIIKPKLFGNVLRIGLYCVHKKNRTFGYNKLIRVLSEGVESKNEKDDNEDQNNIENNDE